MAYRTRRINAGEDPPSGKYISTISRMYCYQLTFRARYSFLARERLYATSETYPDGSVLWIYQFLSLKFVILKVKFKNPRFFCILVFQMIIFPSVQM